jgi:hypothetical protein
LRGRTVESAPLPLVGAQEKSLIGLRDADKLPGLNVLWQLQESVTPEKGRTYRDIELIGYLVQREARVQRFGVAEPFTAHVQSSQRGAGQGTKSLAASPALVSLQPTGVAVLDNSFTSTMRTSRYLGDSNFHNIRRDRAHFQRRQFGRHCLALPMRQFTQRLLHLLHFSIPHLALPASAQSHHDEMLDMYWPNKCHVITVHEKSLVHSVRFSENPPKRPYV